MPSVRFIARPLLAASIVAGGISRLRNAEATAVQLRPTLHRVGSLVPSVSSADELRVARALGAVQAGAGVMLALGKLARLSALILAGTAAVNALLEYREADLSLPDAKKKRRERLLLNLSLVGGVLLAAVDTNGRPGMAWRAEHLAADARRGARHLGRDARRQLSKADRAVRSTATGVAGF